MTFLAVQLIVLHHHFRPGGVRRVIELATPHLVTAWPEPIHRVVLATGEAPDPAWLREFCRRLEGVPVDVAVEVAFGYRTEIAKAGAQLRRSVADGVKMLLDGRGGDRCLIWAHNLGLGRNLHLAREVTAACASRGIPLIAHHHDWWFENRWQHFAAARESSFRTLRAVAGAVFTESPWIAHAAINSPDAAVLTRHFPGLAGWLPNLVEEEPPVPVAGVAAAAAWLRRQLGGEGPVWLAPCRLLRRKNLAEALLLTRWLQPEAWLVTTGGASSVEEQPYADALATAARTYGWRLRLGVLRGEERDKPAVKELQAASETILLTSLQEGFGLVYVEAAAARRPLVARQLPGIASDLASFGFTFPQSYDEVRVDPSLFDWRAERERQRRRFAEWKGLMPRPAARLVGKPAVLAADGGARPVPFSRLTLTAQLEVLAQPVEASWERCVGLNPFLETWRQQASVGRLKPTPWPRAAARGLSGHAYARRFLGLVPSSQVRPPRAGASEAAQTEFLRAKLRPENLYPLLWHSRT